MNYLFIHHNFPAQFHKLSELLAEDKKNKVYFLSLYKRRNDLSVKNVEWLQINSKKVNESMSFYEMSEIFAESQLILKRQGLSPDIIHGHANFGTINFSKEIFPQAKQTGFFEWYYTPETEVEIHYTQKEPVTSLHYQQRQINILSLGALDCVDVAISATDFQKAQFPKEYHSKLQTLHNGIDTEFFKPDTPTTLPEEFKALVGKEVVTYTARSLEPHRGFPQFYRSIPYILETRPNAHIVIVGSEDVTYSKRPDNGKTYLQNLKDELPLDNERVHIFPMLNYNFYRMLLQLSSVHVYLSVPFTLSWSLLESMSCACTIVASATPPVEEVIKHEKNGILTDFHNPKIIAETICTTLKNHAKLEHIRLNARQTVLDNYDEKNLLKKYIEILSN